MVLLENPLCAVANGSARQKEIAELEDRVARATARDNPATVTDRVERLASLYAEDNQHERAIDQARKAMERDRKPNVWMLNLMANSYKALGALDRAEKHYREAMRVAPSSSVPRFNLSLLLEDLDRIDDSEQVAAEAVALEPGNGVYRGWRAILWHRQGRRDEARDELKQAAADLDALESLDPFQRSWRGRFAQELGDRATLSRLERERLSEDTLELDYDGVSAPGSHRRPGQEGLVSDRHPADDTFVEPSWVTARSEADAALRRLRQATTSMERVSREIAALKEWSETTARLELPTSP
jgi:tetratricopeptide (TPR) repeat protein